MGALRWLEFETAYLTQLASQYNEATRVDEIPDPDRTSVIFPLGIFTDLSAN